ncbi:MAG: hypothetical protein MH472_09815 [Bacteroidia bacterium]|nr:hypothetical protein [Bacteroidia bacterium]
MNLPNDLNTWLLPIILIGLAIALVYFILPKLFKNYSLEKGIKLVLLYAVMIYLSVDFYKQEKYGYIVFFAVGAIMFTYLSFIAKKKE